MASQWVMDEMQTADLRDKRLEGRLVKLLDTLSAASTASIPAACHDLAEMVAAYRFFDNDKVGLEEVLAPHIDATYERIGHQKVVQRPAKRWILTSFACFHDRGNTAW